MSKNKRIAFLACLILFAIFFGNIAATAQCTFTGSITSSDPTHANALATSGVESSSTAIQTCPGIFTTTGAIHYDKYDFSNQTGATTTYTVTSDAVACSRFLMGSAYLGRFDPNNLCDAYLASMGSGYSDGSSYSFDVPSGSNFYVLVEEFDPSTYCSSYTVTVSPCPSAAASSYSVSGRITTPDGRGLVNARVIITDGAGNQRSAQTSSFGLYSFADLSGGTYTVNVSSRRYRFAAREITVSASLSNVDLAAVE